MLAYSTASFIFAFIMIVIIIIIIRVIIIQMMITMKTIMKIVTMIFVTSWYWRCPSAYPIASSVFAFIMIIIIIIIIIRVIIIQMMITIEMIKKIVTIIFVTSWCWRCPSAYPTASSTTGSLERHSVEPQILFR